MRPMFVRSIVKEASMGVGMLGGGALGATYGAATGSSKDRLRRAAAYGVVGGALGGAGGAILHSMRGAGRAGGAGGTTHVGGSGDNASYIRQLRADAEAEISRIRAGSAKIKGDLAKGHRDRLALIQKANDKLMSVMDDPNATIAQKQDAFEQYRKFLRSMGY